jgi:hypothetical protein
MVNEIGIFIDYLDFKVPYKILGINILYFARRNLKNAALFPGLCNVIYL